MSAITIGMNSNLQGIGARQVCLSCCIIVLFVSGIEEIEIFLEGGRMITRVQDLRLNLKFNYIS